MFNCPLKIYQSYQKIWTIVTSFRIEEGSCLESIEEKGLSFMSYLNYDDNARRSILVLPSTLTSIAENGLYKNNLIKTIYYCGSTHLSNYCQLMYGGVNAPDIKVTSSYTYDTIFGSYTPKNDSISIAEAKKICDKYKPKASPSPSPSPSHSPSLSPSPLPSSPPTEEGPILSKYSKFVAATYLIKS